MQALPEEVVNVLAARPGARIAVPSAARDGVLEALLAAGGAPAGEEALDTARVETLTPWWGSETDERVIPNEAVLDAAISWTKGCYLGQEAVVMARHRGHPPSLLVRLVLEGTDVPASGTPVASATISAPLVPRASASCCRRSSAAGSIVAWNRPSSCIGARYTLAPDGPTTSLPPQKLSDSSTPTRLTNTT